MKKKESSPSSHLEGTFLKSWIKFRLLHAWKVYSSLVKYFDARNTRTEDVTICIML